MLGQHAAGALTQRIDDRGINLQRDALLQTVVDHRRNKGPILVSSGLALDERCDDQRLVLRDTQLGEAGPINGGHAPLGFCGHHHKHLRRCRALGHLVARWIEESLPPCELVDAHGKLDGKKRRRDRAAGQRRLEVRHRVSRLFRQTLQDAADVVALVDDDARPCPLIGPCEQSLHHELGNHHGFQVVRARLEL